MRKPQSPCTGFANWRNSWQFTWSFRAEARNLSTEALITYFFGVTFAAYGRSLTAFGMTR